MLTDTAAVPRYHSLFIRHVPVSPYVFALNSTLSLYEEFQKHLKSYQQNNQLFLWPVPYYLPGKVSFKLGGKYSVICPSHNWIHWLFIFGQNMVLFNLEIVFFVGNC